MSPAYTLLDTLFGAKPEDAWIYTWDLTTKTTLWHPSVEAAAERARGEDLFFGVALAGQAYGPQDRLKKGEREAAGYFGTWGDLDFGKPGACASIQEALSLLESVRLAPTALVNSGAGLHAYWAYKEPWMFTTDQERLEARILCHRWSRTLQERASAVGVRVDSVPDLERVLRLPGTLNAKYSPARPVELIVCDPERWTDRETIESYLRDWSLPGVSGAVGDIQVRRDAEPPRDKLVHLFEKDPVAERTWERQRKDHPTWTQSEYDLALLSLASQYGWTDQELTDLGIAYRRKHGKELKLRCDYWQKFTLSRLRTSNPQLAAVGRLTELAQAEKEERDVDVKRERTASPILREPAPLRGSVARDGGDEGGDGSGRSEVNAHGGEQPDCDASLQCGPQDGECRGVTVQHHGGTDGIGIDPISRSDAEKEPQLAPPSRDALLNRALPVEPPRSGLRAAKLQLINEALNCPVERLLKYRADHGSSEYVLVLGGNRRVRLAGVESILDNGRMRAKIADAHGVVLDRMKGHAWDRICQALLDVAEEVDLGMNEGSDLRGWLEAYLRGHTPLPWSHQVVDEGLPFRCDKEQAPTSPRGTAQVWIRFEHFRDWLSRTRGMNLTSKDLGLRFKEQGAAEWGIPHRNPEHPEKPTTRLVWPIP